MISAYFVMPIGFETNDDSGMMYILAGYRTGEPAIGTVYSNIIWDVIVSTLYKVIPNVQWYVVVFILLLFLANVIILKSILRIMHYKDWPLWYGIAFYTVFYYIFILYSIILMQFTTLSAMLGMAACALILSAFLNEGKKAQKADFILIVAVSFLSYIIRAKAGYVVFLWCFTAVLIKLYVMKTECGREIKKTAIKYVSVLAVIAILSISALLIHNHYFSNENWKEYREYSAQRGRYKDYPHLAYEEAEGLYEELGWSQELYNLVEEWFFMDKSVNKETFQILNDSYVNDASIYQRIKNTFYNLKDFMANNQFACISIVGAIIMGVFITILSIKKRKFGYLMILSSCYMIMGGLLFYLSFSGRLPFRVFQLCILPGVSVILFEMLLACEQILDFRKKGFIAALVGAVLLGVMNFKNVYVVACSPQRIESIENKEILEKYFSEHPENLYIYDNSFSWLCNPFMKAQTQIPNNYFFWGGASMFSPLYQEQLELNGRKSLYADCLFDSNVFYVTESDSLTGMMVDYLEKKYECKVQYEKVDSVNECSIIKFSYVK